MKRSFKAGIGLGLSLIAISFGQEALAAGMDAHFACYRALKGGAGKRSFLIDKSSTALPTGQFVVDVDSHPFLKGQLADQYPGVFVFDPKNEPAFVPIPKSSGRRNCFLRHESNPKIPPTLLKFVDSGEGSSVRYVPPGHKDQPIFRIGHPKGSDEYKQVQEFYKLKDDRLTFEQAENLKQTGYAVKTEGKAAEDCSTYSEGFSSSAAQTHHGYSDMANAIFVMSLTGSVQAYSRGIEGKIKRYGKGSVKGELKAFAEAVGKCGDLMARKSRNSLESREISELDEALQGLIARVPVEQNVNPPDPGTIPLDPSLLDSVEAQ